MTEIIMKTYDVADEFKNRKDFQEIVRLNKIIDQLYKDEIKSFNEIKQQYQEILDTGGKYHPDYKKITGLLSEAKISLYNKPEVIEYRLLEFEFEKELNSFISDLSHEISDNIPSPNAFGIVKKGGSCHVE